MKIFKRIAITVLSMVLLLGGGSQANAQGCVYSEKYTLDDSITDTETISYNEKREVILQTGVPEEILNQYTPIRIDNLYERIKGKNFVYSGSETKYCNISDGDLEIETYGTINKSDLMIRMDFYEEFTYDELNYGYVESLIMEYAFEWLNAPTYQSTDAFTINWDANLFDPVEGNYFYAVSGYNDAAGDYHQKDYITRPSMLQEGGIGWTLNINSIESDAVATVQYRPRGGGGIFLHAKKRILSKESYALIQGEGPLEYMNIYFDYAHQKIGAEISLGISTSQTGLGFSSGVTFTGGNYDRMADIAKYYFRYY